MIKLLNKDSHGTGALIGILLPVLAYGLLILVNSLVKTIFNLDEFADDDTLRLIGIAFNLIPLRYYLVKAKKEQTGRGVLLVSFIYVVVYFSLY